MMRDRPSSRAAFRGARQRRSEDCSGTGFEDFTPGQSAPGARGLDFRHGLAGGFGGDEILEQLLDAA